jgi:hypothetical protein
MEEAELDLRPGDIVFAFPFGRIVDTGMGPDRPHYLAAEPQLLEYAGREPLGNDVADADHVLGDLQALRMADIERDATLAGILVIELAAQIGIAHTGQRTGRNIARLAAPDRRHRRQPRVGIVPVILCL